MRRVKGSRGQSVAEYSIAIAFVLAAVIGMQVYAKRAVQAKIKKAVETVTQVHPADASVGGDYPGWTGLRQYEPYYARSSQTTVRADDFDERYVKGQTTRKGVLSRAERSGFDAQVGAEGKDPITSEVIENLAADDGWNAVLP